MKVVEPFDPTRDVHHVSTGDTRKIKLDKEGTVGIADIASIAAALGMADLSIRGGRNTSYGKNISKEERAKRKAKKKLAKASKRKNR